MELVAGAVVGVTLAYTGIVSSEFGKGLGDGFWAVKKMTNKPSRECGREEASIEDLRVPEMFTQHPHPPSMLHPIGANENSRRPDAQYSIRHEHGSSSREPYSKPAGRPDFSVYC
mmetsp:Transcript_102811/g.165630  ORF Transcript_102811/g.165630 Transcript_102811/m.165630 type:complete len:115 (-) Transcript_102811:144-488(-)